MSKSGTQSVSSASGVSPAPIAAALVSDNSDPRSAVPELADHPVWAQRGISPQDARLLMDARVHPDFLLAPFARLKSTLMLSPVLMLLPTLSVTLLPLSLCSPLTLVLAFGYRCSFLSLFRFAWFLHQCRFPRRQ
jgi:hypothetical protein